MNFNPLFLDKLIVNDKALSGASAGKGQQSYIFSDIIKLCEEEINSNQEISGANQQSLFPVDSYSIPVNKSVIDDTVLADISSFIQNYLDQNPEKLNFSSDKYQLDSATLIKKSFLLSESEIKSFVEGLIEKLKPADVSVSDEGSIPLKSKKDDEKDQGEKVLMALLSALPNNESVDLKFKGNEINLTVIFSKNSENGENPAQFVFDQAKPIKYFTGTVIEQKVEKGNVSVVPESFNEEEIDSTESAQTELQFPNVESAEESGIQLESGSQAGDADKDAINLKSGNPAAAQMTGDIKSDSNSGPVKIQPINGTASGKVNGTDEANAAEKIEAQYEKTTGVKIDSPSASNSEEEMKVFKVEVIETNFGKQKVEEKAPTIIPINKYSSSETAQKQTTNPAGKDQVNILPINKEVEIKLEAEKETKIADNADTNKAADDKSTENKTSVKADQKGLNVEGKVAVKQETETTIPNMKYAPLTELNTAKDVNDLKTLSEKNFNLNNLLTKEESAAAVSDKQQREEINNELKTSKDQGKLSGEFKVQLQEAETTGQKSTGEFSGDQTKQESKSAQQTEAGVKNQPVTTAAVTGTENSKTEKTSKNALKEVEKVDAAANKTDGAKETTKQQSFDTNKFAPEQKVNNSDNNSFADKVKHFTDVKTPETIKIIQAAEIVNEISRFVQKNEKQSITFQLNPENLGKVQLRVDVQENKVNTYIEVENTQVKQAIQSNIDNLKQTLQNAGMQLNNVNVSLANSEQKFAKSGQFKKKNFGGKTIKVDAEKSSVRQKNLGYNTYEYLI